MELTKDELGVLIKGAVNDALAKHKDDVTPDQSKQRSNNERSDITADEISLVKRMSKSANSDITIPTKAAKDGGHFGNLPAHEKQLANIMLLRNPYHGLESEQKSLSSTVATDGLEWVPNNLSSRLFEDLRLENSLHNLFETIPVDSIAGSMPVKVGRGLFKLGATDSAKTDLGDPFVTTKLDYSCKVLQGYYDYPEDLSEQSVVQLLPVVQQSILKDWSATLDDLILNGDDTATHQDTDIAALGATYHLKAWKGLRKLALAATLTQAGGGVAVSTALLAATIKSLGKYSVRLTDLAVVISGAAQWGLWSEADFKSVDLLLAKWGTQSEIAAGLSGYIKAVPIYNSEFMRSDMAASGVNAATGNTLSGALAFHKQMFKKFIHKDFTIRVHTPDNNAELDKLGVYRITAKAKCDFKPVLTPSATYTTVRYLINADD
jgi:HK97 family phage major capsid protein